MLIAVSMESTKKESGPGRKPLSQTQRVLNAVRRGVTDAKKISQRAGVPLAHVHPLLNRLRERGDVEGFTRDGSLRAAGPPAR